MAKHQEGQLKHVGLTGVNDGQEQIFHCGLGIRGPAHTIEQEQNARRLVVAWNVVDGIPTEQLEEFAGAGGQALLRDAIRIVTGCRQAGFSLEGLGEGALEDMLSVCVDTLHQLSTDCDLEEIVGAPKYRSLAKRLRDVVGLVRPQGLGMRVRTGG